MSLSIRPTMKSISHKLLFLMNILGSLAWILMGAVLFPLEANSVPLNLGLSVSLIYGAIALVPALTAYVLFSQQKGRRNLIALTANFCIVAFFAFSFSGIALQTNLDNALLITMLIIIIPALLNLYALKKLRGNAP